MMNKFFQVYWETMQYVIAMVVAFGGVIVPIVLCATTNNLWWGLLYILYIPLLAAIMAYMETL